MIEKIEREKGRRRDIECEVIGIESVKGAQSKTLVKSPKPGNEAQRKVD